MTARDVFPRIDDLPSQVVNLINGHWRFVNLRWQDGAIKSDGARYFLYNIPFGIVLNSETNPRMIYKRGNAGDFLVHNPGGFYDIMTKAEYDLRFHSISSTATSTMTASPMTASPTTGTMGY